MMGVVHSGPGSLYGGVDCGLGMYCYCHSKCNRKAESRTAIQFLICTQYREGLYRVVESAGFEGVLEIGMGVAVPGAGCPTGYCKTGRILSQIRDPYFSMMKLAVAVPGSDGHRTVYGYGRYILRCYTVAHPAVPVTNGEEIYVLQATPSEVIRGHNETDKSEPQRCRIRLAFYGIVRLPVRVVPVPYILAPEGHTGRARWHLDDQITIPSPSYTSKKSLVGELCTSESIKYLYWVSEDRIWVDLVDRGTEPKNDVGGRLRMPNGRDGPSIRHVTALCLFVVVDRCGGGQGGNPAIPRVIFNRSKDRLKPKVPGGKTLGNLRLFPGK
ncbi:hypothetical protein B0H16DRAFT_1468000 [Mycena metata]|uniref:Uncharacterized protein n=1 Tax=Mycena metata TaxID=1033252 RepID=A0AAD7MUT4_9AGAR|nr:hypothetical protein B0H16DRAFT_1468000 [Mycena metata]